MSVLTVTGTSNANTAQNVTISMPSKSNRIYIRHITVTTKGADIAQDITIDVKDNGAVVYPIAMRSGNVYGVNLGFGKGIPIRAGDCTISISAGGAGVITVLGLLYEIL